MKEQYPPEIGERTHPPNSSQVPHERHSRAGLWLLVLILVAAGVYFFRGKRSAPEAVTESSHSRDTGVIQGVSQAAQDVSFQEMAREQQSLAQVILKDRAVESLSSFIGVDGTNTTMNSGRILINLKPLDERNSSASDVIRRLQPELAKVPGITLHMQPVQDLTVEDRVSRTQFQYTLEDPNTDELNTYAPKMMAAMQKLPEIRDLASDQQNQGLRAMVTFDRETAYRLGISPASIDQTLYDAFGQRQVSTMFTQLNQYHVILE